MSAPDGRFDAGAWLETALRLGVSSEAFWDQTPRETLAAIEAGVWQSEQAQQRDIALAWYIEALTRTKRLPPLKRLLDTRPAKPLHGGELRRRQAEFEQVKRNLDVAKLNKRQR